MEERVRRFFSKIFYTTNKMQVFVENKGKIPEGINGYFDDKKILIIMEMAFPQPFV